MLSYRHGFHAGNPADVFKHTVLVALVRAMQEKPRGIQFVDTHAGAAMYDLASEIALKTAEFRAGIAPLWMCDDVGGPWRDYLDQVRAYNPDGQLRYYPGSPVLVRSMMRGDDRLIVCELHPTEQDALKQRFGKDRQVRLVHGDGYRALESVLPPTGGRGLVLIDPSYEVKTELDIMTTALKNALRRYAHGIYVIWYPLIDGRDTAPDAMASALGLGGEQWLDLRVKFAPTQRLGRMSGCGMVVINCPWRARAVLERLPKEFGELAANG